MNFYDKRIGTPFLGLNEIYEILASFETKRYSSAFHLSYFLNILRSLPKHNLFVGICLTVNLVKLAPTVIPLERHSGKWI
jgi:hypothetical protein